MRARIVITSLIALLIVGFLVVAARADNDDDGDYLVRAVFDGAAFLVKDMDVRVGGANVGHVDSLDVSMPGEIVSLEDGEEAIPGKAVVILRINEAGFQDFRADASCIIRPQSLIGEKYIDCRPTLPRRPDVEPPPPLQRIGDDQPGEGQYLLPLENNYRTVDVDLMNNIMRKPYSERFRIILNELGGTFAARGEDLREIVERANPTLREVNRVFGILANQRRQLARLTVQSDQILQPMARERERVVGFMRSSGEAAEASAEYSAQIRESWAKFPIFLREFRQTMSELGGFAEEATPVARDLNTAAPAFTVMTEELAPFSRASTTAIESLGEAGEEAGPIFLEALPAVRTASTLARSGVRPLYDLSSFLTSTRRTEGFEGLMNLIYNTTAVMNGYDSFGHFARTLVVPTNCLNYETAPTTGCDANFRDLGFSMTYDEMIQSLYALVEEIAALEDDEESGGIEPNRRGGGQGGDGGGTGSPGPDPADEAAEGDSEGNGEGSGSDAEPGDPESLGSESDSETESNGGGTVDLLNYLFAP